MGPARPRLSAACAILPLALLAPLAAQSERRSAETVEKQLAATAGAARVPLLVELARLERAEPKKALALTKEALDLLARHPAPRREVDVRAVRSWALQATSDYPAALAEGRRALAIAEKSGGPARTARAHYHVAVAEWRMSNHDAALEHAGEARRIQESKRFLPELSRTLTLFGAIHRARGQYEKALEAHLGALRISEQRGDEFATARSHNNIGLIYWRLGRLEDARGSMGRALAIMRRAGRGSIGVVLSNIGLILIEQDRPRAALPFLDESLALHAASGNRHGSAKVLSNIGFAHEKLGDDERALTFYRRSLGIREQIGDRYGIVRSMGSIGEIRQRLEDHNEALQILEEALALAERIDARSEKASLLEAIATSRAALGDPERALEEYRRFHELESELVGSHAQRRVIELEASYEHERRAREMAALERLARAKERELASERSRQRLLVLGSSLLGACVLLLLVLFVSRVRALRAVRDSHDRLKSAATRLAESEERYRLLFEGATAPTWLIDAGSQEIVDSNEPARELCTPNRDGPIPLDEVEPAWVRSALTRVCAAGADEEIAEDECWVEASGRLRWAEVRASTVAVEGRSCRLITLRDITDVRAQEAARLRTEKIESLGLLAGGIAHDFNNALTSIIGHIEVARAKRDRHDASRMLDRAEQAADQAARLTSQLLAFAKGGEPVRRVRDVGQLLRAGVELAASGSSMRIDFDIAPDLWCSELDSGQFGQVVSNLVINADQATGEGGRLVVRARNFAGDPATAAMDRKRRYVRIDFEDDGAGVPESARDSIFDPYFTTKKGGSGLGLPTAFAIVTHHEGVMTFESRPGRGATFSVFLPATTDAADESSDAPLPELNGDASILVLEDEPLLQQLYRSMLERWGYSVEIVSDGAAAVATYRERRRTGRAFDLLVMDLTIPGGTGGRQAMAQILEQDPSACAIVVSGYSEDPTLAHYREAGFQAALAKPFREADLARIVHEMLQRTRIGQ